MSTLKELKEGKIKDLVKGTVSQVYQSGDIKKPSDVVGSVGIKDIANDTKNAVKKTLRSILHPIQTAKEKFNENVEHSYIENELGDKGINVHKFEPSTYSKKVMVHVTGDDNVLSDANKHLEHLGLNNEYVAVHKHKKLSAQPEFNNTVGNKTFQGD
jgi:hypothetical protein